MREPISPCRLLLRKNQPPGSGSLSGSLVQRRAFRSRVSSVQPGRPGTSHRSCPDPATDGNTSPSQLRDLDAKRRLLVTSMIQERLPQSRIRRCVQAGGFPPSRRLRRKKTSQPNRLATKTSYNRSSSSSITSAQAETRGNELTGTPRFVATSCSRP